MTVLAARVFKDTYRDSVTLLRLSAELQNSTQIEMASFKIGTPGNRENVVQDLKEADPNYPTESVEQAMFSDLIVVVRAKEVQHANEALEKAATLLTDVPSHQSHSKIGNKQAPTSLANALLELPKAKVALISVPGPYAGAEAMKALKKGMHVMMFSDNVSIEQEVELKALGVAKNLLVMGPDCGTAILDGVPLAFANRVRSGCIGLVGASGTGLQEVSSLIDRLGEGVSQVIGVGGRDVSEELGAPMLLQGLSLLQSDPGTSVIVIVSKPPHPNVLPKVLRALALSNKPHVVHFAGCDPDQINAAGGVPAPTLESAARLAVSVLKGQLPSLPSPCVVSSPKTATSGKVCGLFSGGTFCKEASTLLKKWLGHDKYTATDLGDDEYCVGKPHPMIDGSTRSQFIEKAGKDRDVSVILLDIVLGYGADTDPAGALIPSIRSAIAFAQSENRLLQVVAFVCGTDGDPQGRANTEKRLSDVGVILASSNASATHIAATIVLGSSPDQIQLSTKSYPDVRRPNEPTKLFGEKIQVINLGLQSFVDAIKECGGEAVHVEWKPPALADPETAWILAELTEDSTHKKGFKVKQANEIAIKKIQQATPHLVDIQEAKDVLTDFTGKILLHSGPPVGWQRMCSPQKGACVGAVLFEGWATTQEEAYKLLESGAIQLDSCHHRGCVGPMAGIISPSMPLFVVKNMANGNFAYSDMNPGFGKVLRFGANGPEVINRLKWIREVLGPALKQAVLKHGPVNIRHIMAQALQMGDECHNRNTAASLLLIKALTPHLLSSFSGDKLVDILTYVLDDTYFFLNLCMASCESVMDSALNVPNSTLCVAMARNGTEFGIRVSGCGSKWFTAPAPIVNGLYFPGFGPEHANPDMGDSAITETFGLGGFALAAAPAILELVGGSSADAINYTLEMQTIALARHDDLRIPALDFSPLPCGIDCCKVVDTGSLPLINTGIAHAEAGVGQIGAGILRAPMPCFLAALKDLSSNL